MTSPHATTDEPQLEVVDDFDLFWQQHLKQQPHVKILGQYVPVPLDIPLRVQQQVETGGEQTLAALTTMLGELYSAEIVARWVAEGAGAMQLSVILAWSMLRVQGQPVTFAEAMVQAQQMAADQQARDAEAAKLRERVNRAGADEAERQALAEHERAVLEAGKALSGGTGLPLSPTSAASTASAPVSWQG